MKPRLDFLIVGTMKSGTSSLAWNLRQNPRVAMPGPEGHFFDQDDAFEKGADWYLAKLMKNAGPETEVVGEKTPTYCYQENVAERIHGMFPDVKLVWTLRHPVDRAYSNYLHSFCNGFERLGFEEAIAAEGERVKENIFHGYLVRSRYLEQVQRFLALFPREKMHFILFDDLIRDMPGELAGLCDFLGVAPDEELHEESRGVTRLPRWPSSMVWARSVFGRGKALTVIKELNTLGVKPGYPKLSPERRAELYAPFRDDMRDLSELIGKDLTVWEP